MNKTQERQLKKLDEQYQKMRQAIIDNVVGKDDFVIDDERFKFPDGTKGRLLKINMRTIG